MTFTPHLTTCEARFIRVVRPFCSQEGRQSAIMQSVSARQRPHVHLQFATSRLSPIRCRTFITLSAVSVSTPVNRFASSGVKSSQSSSAASSRTEMLLWRVMGSDSRPTRAKSDVTTGAPQGARATRARTFTETRSCASLYSAKKSGITH
jgi:hypothetical protein